MTCVLEFRLLTYILGDVLDNDAVLSFGYFRWCGYVFQARVQVWFPCISVFLGVLLPGFSGICTSNLCVILVVDFRG